MERGERIVLPQPSVAAAVSQKKWPWDPPERTSVHLVVLVRRRRRRTSGSGSHRQSGTPGSE